MKVSNKMVKCKNDCPKGAFDGCCHYCPEREKCNGACPNEDPATCKDAIFEGTALEVFNVKATAVIQKIGILLKQKAEIEAAEKSMREQLQKAMDEYQIKSFDNEVIKVTYIEASTRESIDSAKLKTQMPDIAAKFTKKSNVKAHVKIELKGDKK